MRDDNRFGLNWVLLLGLVEWNFGFVLGGSGMAIWLVGLGWNGYGVFDGDDLCLGRSIGGSAPHPRPSPQ